MDEHERNRGDAGGGEARVDGQADDPFARWSAARARVRDSGAALHARDGAEEDTAAGAPETVERLREELGHERRRRAAAERAAEKLAAVLEAERRHRLAAEDLADAVFAELELATHATHGVTAQKRRRRRVRRALRRLSGRP